MKLKHKLLLWQNKMVMQTPFISFDNKIKIRKIIVAALKKSGFRGV
jgi:hypothetical protein